MNHSITFNLNGTAHCLWTEAVPIQQLGQLELHRASAIEFNGTAQVWEVRLASAPATVVFADASRETCLHWERATLDSHSNQWTPGSTKPNQTNGNPYERKLGVPGL